MMKVDKTCLKNCVLISGTDHSLSQKIADHLGLELANRTSDTFSDGEVHVQILDDIRGKDVFIIQSTNPPIDQHLFPVLLLTDAARRGFAKSINLVIPYFGYARQDRMAEPNTPISSKVIADILHSVAVNHVITIDLHSAQTQGFFDMTIENITLEKQFADYIEKNYEKNSFAIASPDAGGVKRARKIADLVHCNDVIIIDKNRYVKNKSKVMNIIGDPKGKNIIIIDDMIDTAGTICHAADALAEAGAVEVYASCTHPVLSGPAMENIQKSAIKKLVVLDTIYLPEERLIDKIEQISIAHLLGDAIVRIHEKRPLSPLFSIEKKI